MTNFRLIYLSKSYKILLISLLYQQLQIANLASQAGNYKVSLPAADRLPPPPRLPTQKTEKRNR